VERSAEVGGRDVVLAVDDERRLERDNSLDSRDPTGGRCPQRERGTRRPPEQRRRPARRLDQPGEVVDLALNVVYACRHSR